MTVLREIQFGFICYVMFYMTYMGMCELYPSIQWIHSNPIFAENRTLCVTPLSRVFFVCPNTVTILTRLQTSYSSLQYENLWLVSRQGFESCEVNKSIDKKLKDCVSPLRLLYYEVIFKPFSAVTSAPLFKPGNDYYLIATSDGTQSSLDKVSGGHCRTHKMKLKFYVCTNNTDPRCQSDDLCNGIVPTHAQTTASTTKSTKATTTSDVTSHAVKNTSYTKYIVPTTQITKTTANPGKERKLNLKESTYLIAIGALVFLCVVLTIISVVLIHLLTRNRKSLPPPVSPCPPADYPDGVTDESERSPLSSVRFNKLGSIGLS